MFLVKIKWLGSDYSAMDERRKGYDSENVSKRTRIAALIGGLSMCFLAHLL
ncbi:MAG TPA: hypothetical protein VHR42_10705 [Clostridia bacterium]|nr:hypothetical protein [Clostridia bacterium]